MDKCHVCGKEHGRGYPKCIQDKYSDATQAELSALRTQLTTMTRERDAAVKRLKEAEGLLRDFQKVKMDMDNIHPEGLPAKYWEAYDGMRTVYPKVEKYFSSFLTPTPPADKPCACGPGTKMVEYVNCPVHGRHAPPADPGEMVSIKRDELVLLLWKFYDGTEEEWAVYDRLCADLGVKP